MNANSLLGPDGLNVTQPPLEIEQEERLFNWNDPRNREKREKSDKHIRYDDPSFEQIEEKVILKSLVPLEVPEDSFGTPCRDCLTVELIEGDGCMCVLPVFEEKPIAKGIDFDEDDPNQTLKLRGRNRNITQDRTHIGKGGYTHQTSPHLIGKEMKVSGKKIEAQILWRPERRDPNKIKGNRTVRKMRLFVHNLKKKM